MRVVVTDHAGNVTNSAAVANVKVDNTAPSSAQDDPGAYLRLTINLTAPAADPADQYSNDGSGIDRVEFQRSPAGTNAWSTVGTATGLAGPYSVSYDTKSGPTPDGMYDFRTIAYDRAGNAQVTSTPVTARMVDNTLPTATMNDPGQYLRATAHLASVTDDPLTNGVASGVSQVTYEYANESDHQWHQTPANWDTTAVQDGLYDLRVTTIDRAGNSTISSAVTARGVDNTKPVTNDDAPSGFQSGAVAVHLTAIDLGGSGINTTEYSLDGGAWTAGTDVNVPAVDGAHTVAYFSADNAGNVEPVKTATVETDTTPPACPSCNSSDYMTGTVTLTATPDSSGAPIDTVEFQYSPDGSAWTTIGVDAHGSGGTYSFDWDTHTVADGPHHLRAVITDTALPPNSTTVDLHPAGVVVVDNTAPTVSVGAPATGAVVDDTITIAAVASDDNPITYDFLVNGSSVGSGSTPHVAWDTHAVSDGDVSIQIRATDPAGHSTTSGAHTVRVDNSAPTPTLADPGPAVHGTIALSASSDADTATVEFQRSPAGANTWTTIASISAPFTTNLDTTSLPEGVYDLRAVATDLGGHVGRSGAVTTRVDNTLPTGSVTVPGAGNTIGGPHATLTATANDGGSGVKFVRFEYAPAGTGSWSAVGSVASAPYTISWDATSVATGDYDLRAVIDDNAGNERITVPFSVHVNSTPPSVTLNNPGAAVSGTVTLTATTSASASKVVFEASPAGANSWTTVATDGAAPWSGSLDTTTLTDGVYDLRATASDSLDNSSSSVVPGIRVDNVAPTLVSSTPADGASVDVAVGVSSIVLRTSEPVLGLAASVWAI